MQPTSRGRCVVGAAALLAALCVHGARGDDSADPWAPYKKARAELVPRLEALAAWCNEQKLPLERRRAFDEILVIDPDNAGARRAVRSTRGKDGKWSPPAAPPAARTDPTRLGDVKDKRDEAIGPFKTAAMDIVRVQDVLPAARERVLDDLIGVSPDDEDARAANHEERSGDGWGLVETGAARIRRRELIGAVEEARAKCPAPEKSSANAFELALAPKWSDVRVLPAVRVLAAPNAFEAEPVARTVTVARGVYEAALGTTPPEVTDLRMFLFADKEDGYAAVDRDARANAENRKWARTLSAWWVPEANDVYIWAATGGERVEWGLRYAVVTYEQIQLGIRPRQGWVWEGVGHWFADVVCGTHKTWFVRRSEYADAANATEALRKRLTDGPPDWLGEGRDLEKSGRWPDLRVALGRDVNAMTTEDLLVSYLLARYLIEGRRADVADVLRSVGKGDAPDTWVESRLGMTVEGLDRRLRRWVRESR